jgi:hypothetical protein
MLIKVYIAAIVAYVVAIFFVVPESPLLSTRRGKIEEARNSLKKLRSENFDTESELNEIQMENLECSSFANEIKKKANQKAILIMICTNVFFVVCGEQVMFTAAFNFTDDILTIHWIVDSLKYVYLLSDFVPLLLVDKFGRKCLLLMSFLIMFITLFFFANVIFLKLFEKHSEMFQLIVKICFFANLFGFYSGLGNMITILIGELFSMSAKKYVAPLTHSLLYFLLGAMIYVNRYIDELFRFETHVLLFVHSLFCIGGILFTWFILPETKGKSLNEIQKNLDKSADRSDVLTMQNIVIPTEEYKNLYTSH